VRTLEVMATKTIVSLRDDLTDEPADTTVSFGLDGRDYEIDLTNENAEEFRELLDTYMHAGRKVGGTRRRRRGSSPAAKGYEVSNRGRIPAAVVEAYRAAGN
jgi:nucleoid-associated protein Lsr2